ncbi:MAG: DNA polymerase III subunit gamma/tau [Patescibacteria group bacterium]
MQKTAHHALYRSHRPQTFTDVYGQDHVVDVLKAAIKNKKIAHAYLFVGGRGIGKTSIARILAREIGVSDKDLYEMDAASHTGVDNIRELREAVQVMPFESPYKMYILDEAHMLSKSAWNAFLKTLEEPPAHVIFVMATTDIEKVPDTIQSRCEVYAFKQPTRAVLAKMIADVAKKEGYALEQSAADLIAMLAEGSFRDGLGILQKVLTLSKDKKVEVAEVELVTGAPRHHLIRSLTEALAYNKRTDALAAVESAVSANLDMRMLVRLVLERIRIVLLLAHAPDLAEQLGAELLPDEFEALKKIAADKNQKITTATLRLLLEAYDTMHFAALPHLPLELAIIDATVSGE